MISIDMVAAVYSCLFSEVDTLQTVAIGWMGKFLGRSHLPLDGHFKVSADLVHRLAQAVVDYSL